MFHFSALSRQNSSASFISSKTFPQSVHSLFDHSPGHIPAFCRLHTTPNTRFEIPPNAARSDTKSVRGQPKPRREPMPIFDLCSLFTVVVLADQVSIPLLHHAETLLKTFIPLLILLDLRKLRFGFPARGEVWVVIKASAIQISNLRRLTQKPLLSVIQR